MIVDLSTGKPPKDTQHHADKIWDCYETYRAGSGAAKYMLSQPNPFNNWRISQRYNHDSNFSKASVDIHKNGTIIVKSLINTAILEGRLII